MTCRQRTHRAQAAHRPAAVLAALDAVEAAVSELRRTVFTRGSSNEAAGRLADATSDVIDQLSERTLSPTAVPAVTETVTIPVGASTHATTGGAHTEPPSAPVVTETVTKLERGGMTSRRRGRTPRPAPLDLDTVRLERSADPGVWRVLVGETNYPIPVGYLEPALAVGRRRKWVARDEGSTTVLGGPCPPAKALSSISSTLPTTISAEPVDQAEPAANTRRSRAARPAATNPLIVLVADWTDLCQLWRARAVRSQPR